MKWEAIARLIADAERARLLRIARSADGIVCSPTDEEYWTVSPEGRVFHVARSEWPLLKRAISEVPE